MRAENEEVVSPADKVYTALFEGLVEARRDLPEGPLGRRWVERTDSHEMDFRSAERFGAPEDLPYVVPRLEMIEYDDKVVNSRFGQQVAVSFLFVSQEHVATRFFSQLLLLCVSSLLWHSVEANASHRQISSVPVSSIPEERS